MKRQSFNKDFNETKREEEQRQMATKEASILLFSQIDQERKNEVEKKQREEEKLKTSTKLDLTKLQAPELTLDYNWETNKMKVTIKIEKQSYSDSCWVGLYFKSEADNKKYERYQYLTKFKDFTWEFAAPKYHGVYEARYLPSGTYEVHARSNPTIVGPKIAFKHSLTENFEQIKFSYKITNARQSTSDWIGLYKQGETDQSNYITWQRALGGNLEHTFLAPKVPGNYELKYITKVCLSPIATSEPIEIENRDTVEVDVNYETGKVTISWKIYSVMPSSYDWVGLFAQGQSKHVAWEYATKSTENKLVFDIPKEAGVYTAKYSTSTFWSSSSSIKESESFEIKKN